MRTSALQSLTYFYSPQDLDFAKMHVKRLTRRRRRGGVQLPMPGKLDLGNRHKGDLNAAFQHNLGADLMKHPAQVLYKAEKATPIQQKMMKPTIDQALEKVVALKQKHQINSAFEKAGLDPHVHQKNPKSKLGLNKLDPGRHPEINDILQPADWNQKSRLERSGFQPEKYVAPPRQKLNKVPDADSKIKDVLVKGRNPNGFTAPGSTAHKIQAQNYKQVNTEAMNSLKRPYASQINIKPMGTLGRIKNTVKNSFGNIFGKIKGFFGKGRRNKKSVRRLRRSHRK